MRRAGRDAMSRPAILRDEQPRLQLGHCQGSSWRLPRD
jgi:hypothetical protein